MSDDDESEEWEYYIAHDSVGVSHVIPTRKGRHAEFKSHPPHTPYVSMFRGPQIP